MKSRVEYVIKRLEDRIELHKTKGQGKEYSDGAIAGYSEARKFLIDELENYIESTESPSDSGSRIESGGSHE